MASKFLKKRIFQDVRKIIHDNRLRRQYREESARAQVIADEITSNNSHLIPLFFPEGDVDNYLDVPNPTITELHPYSKHMQNIGKRMKLNSNELSMYFEGIITEDEAIEYFERKDFAEDALIPPRHNISSYFDDYYKKERY